MKGFDGRELGLAGALLLYSLASGLVLAFLPASAGALVAVATVLTVAVMLLALLFILRAIQLYGAGSIEGKLWFRIVAMLVITAVGLVAAQLLEDPRVFAAFALGGFAIAAWAMYSRLRDSGLRPRRRDILLSALIAAALTLGVAGIAFHLGAMDAFGDDPWSLSLQAVVVVFALATTFLSGLLGRMMGGHISKGWHFLSAGSIIFALTYAVVQALKATDRYESYVFVEALQVLALACVAFSAYYQRKRHLELIE